MYPALNPGCEAFSCSFSSTENGTSLADCFYCPTLLSQNIQSNSFILVFFGSRKSEEISTVWLELKGVIWDAEDKHQKSC